MRFHLLAIPGVLFVLAAPAGATPGTPDFTLHFYPGQPPQCEGPCPQVTLVSWNAGEHAEWNLTLAKNYTVGDVRIHQAFAVERARQLVPELDDHYFFELRSDDLWDVDGPARLYNASGTDGEYVYRLGLPGPGQAVLTLRRDVTAPNYTLGPVQALTHQGFLLTTTTSEYAYADLKIRPMGGGEEVHNPTPLIALEQTFPVAGLRPETPYEVRFRFWDWSDNSVEDDGFTLQTPAKPPAPLPAFSELRPEPNSTVGPQDVIVQARYESPESPVGAGGVRLFFDKKEIHEHSLVPGGLVIYHAPSPLKAGSHSVSLEVLNEAGGFGVARWVFTVAGADFVPGPGLPMVILFVATFAWALARRRRDGLVGRF